jgi:hypothetical protein
VSEPVDWIKHELECIRLASDCMQLAAQVHTRIQILRLKTNQRHCDVSAVSPRCFSYLTRRPLMSP